jgi:triosephosphate isomerase
MLVIDVVVCVGAMLDQQEDDQTEAVLDRYRPVMAGLSAKTLTRMSIAYEPVWAIGSFEHLAPFSRRMRRTSSFGVASLRTDQFLVVALAWNSEM